MLGYFHVPRLGFSVAMAHGPMLRSHPLEPAMYVDNKRWALLHADNMSGHESRQISISLGARFISFVSSYPKRTVSVFKQGLHIVLLF